MQTAELQRKHELTLLEVEALRERMGGHFTTQRGLWVPRRNRLGKRVLLHELTHEPVRHPNIVTNEGLDNVLDAYINAATQITIWFLTGFTDNITPLATHTAAAPGTTELTTTDVAESVRETYNANAASGQSMDNVAGPVAQYTADQAFTFFGAQLIGGGTSAFGNTAGVLWSSSLLSPSISMVTLATIDLTYTFVSSDQ